MNYDYPLDLSGAAPSNLVRNEPQVITEINGKFSQIIIPDYAPFYLDNLGLVHISADGTETPLTIDTDFFVGYPYQDLARETGKLSFGAIVVTRASAVGRFKLTYQTIGDKWAADPQYVKNRLLEAVYNPRIAYWDQLTNVQDKFPPQDHDHELTESDKWPALLDAINRVTQAIAERDYNESSIYPTVIGYIENILPALMTKAAVGLSDVENYPVATQEDIMNMNQTDNKYILLPQVLQLLNQFVDGSVTPDIAAITARVDDLAAAISSLNDFIASTNTANDLRFQALEAAITSVTDTLGTTIPGFVTRLNNVETIASAASSQVSYFASRIEALENNQSPGSGGGTPNIPTPFMYFMAKP